MADTYSIRLTSEQLDLLDDVLEYYVMSDMGGGDHADADSRHQLRAIRRRVDRARERAGTDVDAEIARRNDERHEGGE